MNVGNHKFQRVLRALGRIPQDNQPFSPLRNPHPEAIIGQEDHEQEVVVVGAKLVSTQPIYSGIGVGVYQGEAIAIQRWGFSAPRPIWSVYNLQSENLTQIPPELYQQLRYLSCLLEACYRQPSLWTNYLSKKGEIKVGLCHQQLVQHEGQSLPSEEGQSNSAFENLTQSGKLPEQPKQECHECPLWQVYQASLKSSNEK